MIRTTREVQILTNPLQYLYSFPNIIKKGNDGNWIETGPSSEDLNVYISALTSQISNEAKTLLHWSGSFVTGYLGSYLESSSGEPPEILVRNFSRERKRVRSSNFSALKRRGEIVVHDYDSDVTISIRAQAPDKSKTIIGGGGTFRTYATDCSFSNTVPDPRGNGRYVSSIGGRYFTRVLIEIPYRKYSSITGTDFGSYDIDAHMSQIVGNLDNAFNQYDGGIITAALAKANQGQFDFLSNLAELPETIESLLRFISTIFAMYKDAKRGEIRLQNRISKLRLKANPTLNDRKKIADLLSAVSELWLSYRLAIKPTVGMIEDALYYLRDKHSEFFRYRETRPNGQLSCSYDGEESTVTVIERAFIKRAYSSDIDAMGFPPLGAAWEVVPLSFVLDRYVNIGEWLTAQFSPDLSVKQGATYSWKCSGDTAGITIADKVSYQITVSSYRRRVIDPYRYCGLNYPPSRTNKQDLDHLSLFWKLVLEDYLRPIKTRNY